MVPECTDDTRSLGALASANMLHVNKELVEYLGAGTILRVKHTPKGLGGEAEGIGETI
jgi:hypothetical protein